MHHRHGRRKLQSSPIGIPERRQEKGGRTPEERRMAVREVQPKEHHDKGPKLMHLHSLQDQKPKYCLHDPVVDGHGEELKRAEVSGLL